MKKYLFVISLFSFLFGQEEYQFFLTSDENLKLVGDNYDIIKSELDKMLSDYKSKIDLDNYWKEKYTERVYTGSSFDQDGYTSALLSMNNPSQSQANSLRSSFTRSTYKNVVKERNRIIERGETLFTKEVEWSDVVSYYGGYSELSKLGISKEDKSKLDLDIVFEKIELTGPSTCLAHVKINGNNDALKFHKIPKPTYKYNGTYKINYEDDYLTLYNGGSIWIDFKFDEKKYLTIKETTFILDKSILPSTENYHNSIIEMLDDLVPKSVLTKADPNFFIIKNEYIEFFGKNKFRDDLILLTKEQLKENITKEKARVFEINREKLRKEEIQNYYDKQMKTGICLLKGVGCIAGVTIISTLYHLSNGEVW